MAKNPKKHTIVCLFCGQVVKNVDKSKAEHIFECKGVKNK